MNFQESLDYLLSLGFERSVKKFGLENTTILLEALNNPQNNFLKIQIAGTNGKGSTCAFLEAILLSAGISCGVNTSPHLVSVTERIRVNGMQISETSFAKYTTKVRKISEGLVASGDLPGLPTFFEHITAIAQLVFADDGIKVAILEVGLGGRFDATTATMPEIVGITPIDLDHTKTLGGTLAEIAAEKSAIIRKDTKVYSVPQKKEAQDVVNRKCRESGVEANWATVDVKELEGGVVQLNAGKSSYEALLEMPGKHQWTNATLALYIAEGLRDMGFQLSAPDMELGLERATHAGRLEYSDGILFDGAHNVAGAAALAEYVKENVSEPVTMIYGSSSGKNLEELGRLLFPLAKNVILTTAENPRAVDASEFLSVAKKYVDKEALHIVEGAGNALELGKELSADGLLLVTGSLYLIGEIKAYLTDRAVERRKKKKDN